ncbi:MAG: mandelate racemase/muconate lactonizing enzyme family protein [Candidatus Lokiarchaeota archaeon]|nr:mandelate racemase/muconate lactonizing enzyme family protein [Candidatus Lokiarchaeota archaeon]
MKISKIEFFHIFIPIDEPFQPAWIPGYTQTRTGFTLIRLTTDTGLTGISVGMSFAKEHAGLGTLVAPYLLGLDPEDPEKFHKRLIEGSYFGQRNFWMDTAIYDILGKSKGEPIWKLIGGKKKPIPTYWATAEVCEPEKHSNIIERARQLGYKGVKLRVHADTVEKDIETITQTRDLVDQDYPLMIDANQGAHVSIGGYIPIWTLERAKAFIEGIKDANIYWLEEPLEMHRYEELGELREYMNLFGIYLAGGELNYGWNEVRMMLHFGSYDIYQSDITTYGMYDTITCVKNVLNRGLKYTPHAGSNAIGLLINMHCYSLSDYSVPLEYSYRSSSYDHSLLINPPIPVDGYLELPDSPGLGIEIDWEKVRQYGEKFFELEI